MSEIDRAPEPEPSSMSGAVDAAAETAPIDLQSNSAPPSAPASAASLASVSPPLAAPPGKLSKPRKIEPINRAIVSERSRRFLRQHYPGISIHDWNDWKWQVRNRVRRLDMIEKVLTLTDDERASVEKRTGNLPIAITPYYLSLLSPDDPNQPLRKR